jgi:hypothetical protein
MVLLGTNFFSLAFIYEGTYWHTLRGADHILLLVTTGGGALVEFAAHFRAGFFGYVFTLDEIFNESAACLGAGSLNCFTIHLDLRILGSTASG